MRRISREQSDKGGGGNAPSSDLQFVKSGCTILDLVLGGGYPLGRIANVVGDKSTGKTLLAIEGAANLVRQYPHGKVYYAEGESAFNKSYAGSLGMPLNQIEFSNPDTVEDFQDDLHQRTEWHIKEGVPGLYILDSLDSLSDRKELKRKSDEATYGGDKAKQMSQLFRKLIRPIERANLAVLIISQVRDKIGISFGRKTTRSGGRALDFYASQVVYLQHLQTLSKVRNKYKRAIGVKISAKCDKNKIDTPHEQCTFQIRFKFGINSTAASLQWLIDANKLDRLDVSKREAMEVLKDLEALKQPVHQEWEVRIRKALKKAWKDVDHSFAPSWRKYE